MAAGVLILGLAILVLGLVMLFDPSRIASFIEFALGHLYLIAFIRLGVGIFLVAAAPVCNISGFVRIFGILALISGVLTPVLGKRFGEWWSQRSGGMTRGWSAIAVGFGALLVYAGS